MANLQPIIFYGPGSQVWLFCCTGFELTGNLGYISKLESLLPVPGQASGAVLI